MKPAPNVQAMIDLVHKNARHYGWEKSQVDKMLDAILNPGGNHMSPQDRRGRTPGEVAFANMPPSGPEVAAELRRNERLDAIMNELARKYKVADCEIPEVFR